MYIPHFAYSFIHWWTHGCFDILAVVKNAAMNICKQIFFKTLEWNCHIIIPSLIFFYTAAISPYISTNRVQQFQFLHILISIYYFTLKKIVSIQIDVRWYLIVILTCISLIIRNVKDFYLYLLVTCISPLDKCLFKSFVHFKLGFVVVEI